MNRSFPLTAVTNLGVVAISLIVVGCAPRQQAEVVERTVLTQRQQDERIGGQFIRIVQPGDTLYSIAFVTGLDVNKVAAWNGIRDTSKLKAGQRIRLTEPLGFKYQAPRSVSNKPKGVAKNSNAAKTQKTVKAANTAPTVAIDEQRRSTKAKAQATTPVAKARTPVAKTRAPVAKARAPVAKKQNLGNATVNRWVWPLRGTLVNRFNPSQGQQGINIQGQRGQPVNATADGEVVYAGNSLKGYGNLVIIKHSATYLSAYANNQSISVKEGELVEQGQSIALLGSDSQGKAISQFQIRKNGNPVDPMSYLN